MGNVFNLVPKAPAPAPTDEDVYVMVHKQGAPVEEETTLVKLKTVAARPGSVEQLAEGDVWDITTNRMVFLAPLDADASISVVSESGSEGSLLVSGNGFALTLEEGLNDNGYSKTLQTKADGDTLICYANYAGRREAWVDNAEGAPKEAFFDRLEVADGAVRIEDDGIYLRDVTIFEGGIDLANDAGINIQSGVLRVWGGKIIISEVGTENDYSLKIVNGQLVVTLEPQIGGGT